MRQYGIEVGRRFGYAGIAQEIDMGRFTVFIMGCPEGLPVDLDVGSVCEIEKMIGGSRFIAGELVDVPNGDGVCGNRAALIPIARIQMIMEDGG